MTAATAQALPSTSTDPATDYARGVANGTIIAGPQVRNACRRHLRDLTEGPGRGLHWSTDSAARAIGFFRDVLCLNGGDYEGEAFHLLGWQAFVIGSLFGWLTDEGTRRFRVAYIETGKGSGKSPLAAGVGLYGLVADREMRAEVYAAATKKDQAMILFRDAVAMVDQSPHLAERIEKTGAHGREWNLAYHRTGSFFRPIASDGAQSGPRPHVALLDEIHEHKNGDVVELIRAGTKSRRQALIFMITNSGADKTSVCFEHHDYAMQVAAGQREDDSFFGYVCMLDEKDDPLTDEGCWPKANPSLQQADLPGVRYIREQVTQARGMPSKESKVRRLAFCQWVGATNPLISEDHWQAANEPIDPDLLLSRRCYGGLDLSSTTDLTSLVLEFEPVEADPFWRLLSFFWLPGDGLHDKALKDNVPYIAWRDAGWLEAPPGRAIDKKAVLARLVQIVGRYDVQSVGFDRWRIEDFKALAADEGADLPLEPFGQGFKDMAPALEEFERRLINSEIKHDGNPVLTWNAANAVADTDPAGNRKVTKKKATGRVDGIVAAIMATGRSMSADGPVASVYETRGILSL